MIDALVSLPIISFFALPLLSSYSTSLNILFFYMTWTTLVLSHSPLNVEIFGTLFVRLLFYLLPGLLFLGFDCAVPSLAETIKAHGEDGLPLKYGRHRLGRIVAVSMANVFLGIGAQIGVEVFFTHVLQARSALKVITALPVPWSMAKHIVYGFMIQKTLTYYVHLHVLHRWRNTLNTLHNSWSHSLYTPFSLTATYDHPLPYLLAVWLPAYLPALLFRFHILTYLLFLSLVSLEQLFTYSGYSVLPSTIILTGMARRVDAHMMTRGKGNFETFGLLDWAHGTTIGKDVLADLEDEAEKHDVRGKTDKAMERGSNLVDGMGEKIRKKRLNGKKMR